MGVFTLDVADLGLCGQASWAGRWSGGAPRDLLAHHRRNLGAEQFNRPHHLGMGKAADAQLHLDALMAQDLGLEQNFLDNSSGDAHKVVTP